MPRITVSVPDNHKNALNYLRETRGVPGNRPTLSELVREMIADGLAEADLPEEARDLLDDDLLANAGDTDGDGEPEVGEA